MSIFEKYHLEVFLFDIKMKFTEFFHDSFELIFDRAFLALYMILYLLDMLLRIIKLREHKVNKLVLLECPMHIRISCNFLGHLAGQLLYKRVGAGQAFLAMTVLR